MGKTLFTLASLAVAALVTYAIIWIPFIFLNGKKELPQEVTFLGRFLPPAIMISLVVFCLRHIDITEGSGGIPEAISLAITVIIHKGFRNMFLSVISGTAVYIVLMNFIFV